MLEPATADSQPPSREPTLAGQLLLGCFQTAALVVAGGALLVVTLMHASRVSELKTKAATTAREIRRAEERAQSRRQVAIAAREMREAKKPGGTESLSRWWTNAEQLYALLARHPSSAEPAALQAWYQELAVPIAGDPFAPARARIQDAVLADLQAGTAPATVLAPVLVRWFDSKTAPRLAETLSPGRASNRAVLEALLKIHLPKESLPAIKPWLDDPAVGDLAQQVLRAVDPAAPGLRPPAAGRTEPSGDSHRLLLQRFAHPSSVRNPRDFHVLWETPTTPEQRAEVEELLRKHLQSPGVSVGDYVTLAIAWQSERLLADLADYVERNIQYLRGERGFWPVQRLAARTRDPRLPALLLRTVDDRLTRPGGNFPDPDQVARYGAAAASVLGGQIDLLVPHLAANSALGDVARGALFWSGDWPEPAIEQIRVVLADPQDPAWDAVASWLAAMPPPADVCDALLPTVTQRVPRQAVGTMEADIGPAAVTASLATAGTAERCALAATRLQADNPAAAQTLVLRLFPRFPRETAAVLAQAAEAGAVLPPPSNASPWLQPFLKQAESQGRAFRPPTLDDPRWGDRIDGGLAAVLLGTAGGDVSPGLIRVAGAWGGWATAAVLQELSRDERFAARRSDISAAIQLLQRRLEHAAAAEGGTRA